jgi:hypothetical protein
LRKRPAGWLICSANQSAESREPTPAVMTPRSVRARPELLAGWAVRHCRAAATFPTDPHPPVKLVKINRPGQHQQPCCDEFLTSPGDTGEPATGDDPNAFCAEVVAALGHLGEVINQRLQFGLLRG